MIRLYFDWNAVVGLKYDRPSGLLDLLRNNAHRFHIFYSTSHIGDIYKGFDDSIGVTPVIQADLDFLDELTDSHIFYYEKPRVVCDIRSTLEIFEGRIAAERHSIAKQVGTVLQEASPETEPITPLTSLMMHVKDDPMAGAMSLLEKMRTSDLYKDLRKVVQTGFGINRDQLYAHADPFNRINQVLANSGMREKSLDGIEAWARTAFKNDPEDWFNNITVRYQFLDMAGYQEDEIEWVQNKTFQNIIEDASHTAFASQCDFYVSDDRRNRAKAKRVYDSFSINTTVMTTGEFNEFLIDYLRDEGTRPFLEDVWNKINDFKKAGHQPDNPKQLTVFFKTFVLDYFNKAYYHSDVAGPDGKESWMIVLTKDKPTNGRFTTFEDINILVIKISNLFGKPAEEKYLLDEEDIGTIKAGGEWYGRGWVAGHLWLGLKSINGYFQLYIYPLELR